jgi:hypothetical protein
VICESYFVLGSITIFISEQDARQCAPQPCTYINWDFAMNFDLHNKFAYFCGWRTIRTQKVINIEDNRHKCSVYTGYKDPVLSMNVKARLLIYAYLSNMTLYKAIRQHKLV